jgi:hypothetical protein
MIERIGTKITMQSLRSSSLNYSGVTLGWRRSCFVYCPGCPAATTEKGSAWQTLEMSIVGIAPNIC